MDTELLIWIATYATRATILFNFLRYAIRLNLPSTLILSVSVSFLMLRIRVNGAMGDFLTEFFWSLAVLAILITIISVSLSPTDKASNSTGDTNNQRKKWTAVFRIRKG